MSLFKIKKMNHQASWMQEVTQTAQMGKTHPDTFFCSDLQKLAKDYKDKCPEIKKVEIYSDGTNIFGYEVTYDGGYQVGHHIGSMLTPAVKCHTL